MKTKQSSRTVYFTFLNGASHKVTENVTPKRLESIAEQSLWKAISLDSQLFLRGYDSRKERRHLRSLRRSFIAQSARAYQLLWKEYGL